MKEVRDLDIAVIGMAMKFPQADSADEFWNNLATGKDCITRRKNMNIGGRKYAFGAIASPYDFDNEFFDMSESEAATTAPQERLLLEVAYNAVEDAGIKLNGFKGRAGIVCGTPTNEYRTKLIAADPSFQEQLSDIIYLGDSAAARVAYKLDLNGPVVQIATACATSLSAVHLACASLLNYEADIMLAGASNINPDQECYDPLEGVLSDDGYVRAFDKSGSGIVPANGTAIVVLRRLSDAVSSGDNIYAVIKGSAIGCDGTKKASFTAPSVAGETNVMSAALEMSELSASDICYIETHGTATSIGDSIELQSIESVYGHNNNGKIYIGSVKNNCGHMNFTAGIAGFIKAVLVLKNRLVPPHINVTSLKEEVEKSALYTVNTEPKVLGGDALLHAAVSSFGIGGANAHVILEEYPEESTAVDTDEREKLFVVSAKSAEALKRNMENVKNFVVSGKASRKDIMLGLINDREKLPERAYFIAGEKGIVHTSDDKCISCENKEVIFMFPGAGASNSRLAQEIYEKLPIFKKHYDKCRDIVYDITCGEYDLYKVDENEDLSLKITASNYSVAMTLEELGCVPDKVIGHSLGEYSMAAYSGVISLEDALKLVYRRMKLIRKLPAGHMVTVAVTPETAAGLLPENAYISCINAYDRIVISCTDDTSYNEVVKRLREKKCFFSTMHANRPAHTKVFRMIENEYRECFRDIVFRKPRFEISSTFYGRIVTSEEIACEDYWIGLMENCTLFADAFRSMVKDENKGYLCIESGANDSLSSFVKRDYMTNDNIISLCALKLPEDDIDNVHEWCGFIKLLGELWRNDIRFDISGVFTTEKARRVRLPLYSFDRHTFNRLSGFYPESSALDICEEDYQCFGELLAEQDRKDDIKEARDIEGLDEAGEKLCVSEIFTYFRSVGLTSGVEYTLNDIYSRCGISGYYEAFAEFMANLLCKTGYAEKSGSRYIFSSEINIADGAAQLKESTERCPSFGKYFELLHKCAEAYGDVLSGKRAGNEIIYPRGTFDMLNEIGRSVPEVSLKDTVLAIVPDVIESICRNAGSRIRILEIGAGTGKLTWRVMEKLKDMDVEYWFTDIGGSFVADGKRYAEANKISNMNFRVYNIENDPAASGLDYAGFDLVLGLDVIQATSNVMNSVANLKKLIKPLGYMIMVQSFWISDLQQLIFGYAPGWWNYNDDPLRRGRSIILNEQMWKDVFRDSGLEDVRVITGGYNGSRREVGILTGRKTAARSMYGAVERTPVHTFRDTRKSCAAEETSIENSTADSIAKIICDTIAKDCIDRNQNFFELGLDSLSILIIKSKIQETLGKDLKVKDFYTYHSVEMLSEFIGQGVSCLDEGESAVSDYKSIDSLFDGI